MRLRRAWGPTHALASWETPPVIRPPAPAASTDTAPPPKVPGFPPDLDGPLAYLAEQLWGSTLRAGRLRLSRRAPEPGWREVERYLVLPSISRATMLLPGAPNAALRGALLNYRGLRSGATALQRSVLGAAVTTRMAMPFPRLSVQVPDEPAGRADQELPLAALERILGTGPLMASIGVRTGANRKATLQLVDPAGHPRGFAKLGWDAASSAGIRAERAALAHAPREGRVRVPHLLASGPLDGVLDGVLGEHPYVVTAPLPLDVRAVRGTVPAPTAEELAVLCPRDRLAPIAATGQFRALRGRLDALVPTATTRPLLALAGDLLDALTTLRTEVPVTARWHGDLTPWNVARDGAGTLWCWDWESSEPDAVAGLDALHWCSAVRRERGERLDATTPAAVLADAGPLLRAAALPRACEAGVAALWAATIAERALGLALGPTLGPRLDPTTGTRPDEPAAERWEDDWVRPDELAALLLGARRLLTGSFVDAGDRETA
ncbi:hypothetical protein GHK92_02695 [Nocardioides sp. dk4132]|uniref:hypothetical protein n=1 Tax=unclassified Nocardioides TaxID=2615069 RepID=UPI00129498D3|nr:MULTISPECIES: hypothetical protein [unclassified Nocardioides]MQW74771.1 hypothetical protein [Nocardioides sp. dk4132]QGA06668.1 hypothetical protein GFH29_04135 [Nocardioides sp. dk884]